MSFLMVQGEGFDLLPADPQLHGCKRSLHRKVALQIATGNLHPEGLSIEDTNLSPPKEKPQTSWGYSYGAG